MPSRKDPEVDFKRKWKHCLQDTMTKTKEQPDKAQEKQKKKYDARLRKQSDAIHEYDYAYLMVKRKIPKYHRRNFAPVAEGPFKVTNVNDNTIFIEKTDQTVENVSRSRLVLEIKLEMEKEVQKLLQPMMFYNYIEGE